MTLWRRLLQAFAVGLLLGTWVQGRARRRAHLLGIGSPRLRSLAGVEELPQALLQSTRTGFTEGNRVEWLFDGAFFPALLEAVGRAERTVHIDLFIFQPGPPGDALAEALCERARAGVSVQVLVDPLGSQGIEQSLMPRMRRAGAEVRLFRPRESGPRKFLARTHRKLVLVDGRVGFTGGFGLQPQWLGSGERPDEWRDTHVRVEGPVVQQMLQAFVANWMEAGGGLLPSWLFQPVPAAGPTRAAFVSSREALGWTDSFWLTFHAMALARSQLWVANAYFAPPLELLSLLIERARAGVDVRLMLPGPYNDHPTVRVVQRSTYPSLQRAGVRIFEYQPSMMHAKTMLVDGRIGVVGSINLDPLSMYLMEEGSLVVDDEALAAQLARQWARDEARAREMPHRLRPFSRMVGRLATIGIHQEGPMLPS